MKRTIIALCALALPACWAGSGAEEDETKAPPAAAIALGADTISLQRQLAQLEVLAATALREDGASQLHSRAMQAEALTDRLLEAPLPYDWLSNRYSLEARLRQMQSQADRVIARIQRNDPEDSVRADLKLLREDVLALRRKLTERGMAAPPPIDSLLAQGPRGSEPPPPSRSTSEPSEPSGPRLLGQPTVAGETGGAAVQPDTMLLLLPR